MNKTMEREQMIRLRIDELSNQPTWSVWDFFELLSLEAELEALEGQRRQPAVNIFGSGDGR